MSEQQPVVFCQQWEESEAGWGVRPDGYSLHLSLDDAKQYIKDYWDDQPEGPAPAEYSRPCGEPYACHVAPEVYAELQEKADNHGVRFWQNKYPDKMEGCRQRRAWEPMATKPK